MTAPDTPETIEAMSTPSEEKETVEPKVPPPPSYDVPPAAKVKTLLSWSAPGRPYRKRGKQYFMSILFITMLVEIIIFLFSEYLLMMVVLSLAFVAVALAIVPPHPYHYRISSEGVTIEDHFYLWQELYDFYFRRQHDQDVLVIRTKVFIPGELSIMLGNVHVDQIKAILLHFLPYREVVHQTFMEKSGKWISQTFPLEKNPA